MMIRITACAIVKNEAKNLPKWLSQMPQVADEVLIVDTGSTDDTVALALAAGARVEHFSWCNDFAAAKNFCLDQATGDWLLFLDADEYFAEETMPRIRPAIEAVHDNRHIGGFISPWINIDPENNNSLILNGHQIRIFRKDPMLRFVGHIHEALDNLAKAAWMIDFRLSDLVIYHTGYHASNAKEKARRNLNILLSDIEKNGETPEQYTYLVDSYYALDDFEKAAHYARLAVENDGVGGQIGQLRKNTCRLIDSLRLLKAPDEEQLSEIEEVIAKHPHWPEGYWLRGFFYYLRNRLSLAEPDLEKFIYLADKQMENPKIFLENSEAEQTRISDYNILGIISTIKNQPQRAMDYFVKVLSAEPYREETFMWLYPLIRQKSSAERIEFLHKYYPDTDFLVPLLKRFPLDDVFYQIASPAPDSYEGAMATKSYAKAMEAAVGELFPLYEATRASLRQKNPPPQVVAFSRLLLPEQWK